MTPNPLETEKLKTERSKILYILKTTSFSKTIQDKRNKIEKKSSSKQTSLISYNNRQQKKKKKNDFYLIIKVIPKVIYFYFFFGFYIKWVSLIFNATSHLFISFIIGFFIFFIDNVIRLVQSTTRDQPVLFKN